MNFDRYADEIEQDFEDGHITKEEYRQSMRELSMEYEDLCREDACAYLYNNF